MRTNIVPDDELVVAAIKGFAARSKRELVDLAPRELVAHHGQRKLKRLVRRDLIDPAHDIRRVRRDMDRGAG